MNHEPSLSIPTTKGNTQRCLLCDMLSDEGVGGMKDGLRTGHGPAAVTVLSQRPPLRNSRQRMLRHVDSESFRSLLEHERAI